VESLPFPVHIHTPDGVTIYLNEAGCRRYGVRSDELVGKYSFPKDPDVAAAINLGELRRALKGETVFFPGVKFPFNDGSDLGGEDNGDGLYRDVTVFPLKQAGYVSYLVTVEAPCAARKKREEIERAKEFIYARWFEKFDLEEVVKASGLSKAHFTRLFKKHTGLTPHEYYTDIKIAKLKEKLGDPKLSVLEAFAACNLSYGGHFANVFKQKTGMLPLEYRKKLLKS